MSIGNIVKRKLAWRSLFLGLFLSLALASIAYAYAYTQTWQDHFTTDPLGSISDCGSSSDGPGPTAWYWFQRGGCIAHSGSTVSVYTNVDLRDGPDLYREDLGGILPTNWRIDARFNFYEKYGFGTQVTITCQGKSTCAWLAKPQIIAYAGLVGGSRNVFDIHLLDPSLGGMWGMEWSADSHVGVWHTLRVERYGTNLYLYLDNVLQHTSTNVDERYRPSAIIFGDPTVQPASGQWTRLSGDHVTIYNVTACSVPGKPALSVSPSGCTNNSTPTWSWSASDGGCAIDQYEVTRSWAANFTTTSTSYTPTLGTGSYWLGVRAHNSAGWGSWSDSVTVQVDLSGPNTPTHASPADNYCTNNNTPTLTANATSDVGCGGGVQYYIRVWNSAGAIVANSDWMGGTSYTTPALATGTYTWQILARDRFGNNSAWSGARTIMIDTSAPPTPSLNSPANNTCTTNTTPPLTVNSVSDVGCGGGVKYQIVLDDDPNFGSLNWNSGWQTGTSYTGPALSFGTYYWRARAMDGFGYTSGWSGSWSLTVNGSPSNGTVSPASGCSGSGTVVRFTTTHSDPNGVDNINYVRLLLNSNVDGNNSAFYGYYNLNNNHFYLYDSDRNMNWMDAGVDAEWDVSSLYATLKASSTHSTSGNTLTVYWDIEFKPGWTENVNAYLYTVDDCGAVDGWTDKGDYGVDTSGPNTPTHASPADNYCTNNNTPTLTANATSDVGCGGGVQYYIRVWNSAGAIVANSDWMGGTSYTTPALATGTYTWQILARDRFGNESAWSSARTIMIDQTAPPTPSLSSPADNSYTTDTTPTLTVNVVSDVGCNGAVLYQIVVDDDPNFGSLNADSGWQTGTSYTASPALTPGPNYYYWRARAEDGFGNTSGWSASWKFKVVRSGSIVGTVWNDTNNVGNTLLCESSPQGPAYTSSKVRVAYSCETWDPNYDSAVGTCLTETSLTNGTYSFSNVPVYEDFGGGAYTVSITPPSGGWIQTTPTCNAVVVRWQNDQRTANFGISNNPLSWIQGVNGDIYSNNGIRVQVPTKAFWGGLDTYNGYNRWFLDANPYPGTHLGGGVVISGSTDNPSCGGGTSVDGRCSRRPNGDLTEPGWRVRDEQMAWPSLNLAGLKIVPLPSIPWGALDSGKVYYTDNPLTVPNSYNLNANGVAVIYVKDANVTFAAPGFNCSLPSCNPNRMGIIFVVENGQVTIPGGTTQIDALILVIGGTIRVEGTNVANNLTVYGMLYAQNGINSARTLTDNRTPAVQVKYNPLYLLPNRLAKPQLTWREIAP